MLSLVIKLILYFHNKGTSFHLLTEAITYISQRAEHMNSRVSLKINIKVSTSSVIIITTPQSFKNKEREILAAHSLVKLFFFTEPGAFVNASWFCRFFPDAEVICFLYNMNRMVEIVATKMEITTTEVEILTNGANLCQLSACRLSVPFQRE